MCLELKEIGLNDTLAPIFYLPGIIWIFKMVDNLPSFYTVDYTINTP